VRISATWCSFASSSDSAFAPGPRSHRSPNYGSQ
jgi:hypothetical protein